MKLVGGVIQKLCYQMVGDFIFLIKVDLSEKTFKVGIFNQITRCNGMGNHVTTSQKKTWKSEIILKFRQKIRKFFKYLKRTGEKSGNF